MGVVLRRHGVGREKRESRGVLHRNDGAKVVEEKLVDEERKFVVGTER
jgi:hypothetical protein